MGQLIRFCVVGCLNTGISYLFFYLSYRYWSFSSMLAAVHGGLAELVAATLRHLGILSINGAVANVIGFTAGMVNSFALNRLWTFKSVEKPEKQAGKFILINLACLLASTVSIFVGTDLMHWSYNVVWITTTLFLTAVNFVASKYWVFC